MGLVLPQKVEMTVNSTSKQWEDKGYQIPKKKSKWVRNRLVYDYGKTFWVDVLDLPPSSDKIVKYSCDECGDVFSVSMFGYNLNTHENGKHYCQACSNKIFHSGENNFNWNPKLTDEDRKERRIKPENQIFIRSVLKRDNYICQVCGSHAEEVHHLDGYNWCIERRHDVTNGISLCPNCHKNFHSIYGLGNNTKEQFYEWFHAIELGNYEVSSLPKVYCLEDDVWYNDRFEAAKILGCHHTTIYNACAKVNKTAFGKHYMYEYDYIRKTKKEIENILSCKTVYYEDKRILCLSTGILFDSYSIAANFYNYKSAENILNVCKGKQKSAASYNGMSLKWMRYSDFIHMSSEEQQLIKNQYSSTWDNDSFLFTYFNSITLI